jgi:hypothetical protein
MHSQRKKKIFSSKRAVEINSEVIRSSINGEGQKNNFVSHSGYLFHLPDLSFTFLLRALCKSKNILAHCFFWVGLSLSASAKYFIPHLVDHPVEKIVLGFSRCNSCRMDQHEKFISPRERK